MIASKKLIAALLLLPAIPVMAQSIDADPRWQLSPPADYHEPDWTDDARPYVALRGSYAVNGNNMTTYIASPPTALRASYGSGGGGSLALGVHLPLNLRLELEGMYRWQPLSRFSLNGTTVAATGAERIAAPMLNLFWDVPMPDDMQDAIQPFVGLGVGAAYHATDVYDGPGNKDYINSTRWDLAYSFMGGFAVPIDENARLTAMYRWMQIRDVNYRCGIAGPAITGGCVDTNTNSSSVDLGLEVSL